MNSALVALVFAAILQTGPSLLAQTAAPAADKPFTVEYDYKATWGYADEFLSLFKKNHYPDLKTETEIGRIQKHRMDPPPLHGPEVARWDYRVPTVFKNSSVANDDF